MPIYTTIYISTLIGMDMVATNVHRAYNVRTEFLQDSRSTIPIVTIQMLPLRHSHYGIEMQMVIPLVMQLLQLLIVPNPQVM